MDGLPIEHVSVQSIDDALRIFVLDVLNFVFFGKFQIYHFKNSKSCNFSRKTLKLTTKA